MMKYALSLLLLVLLLRVFGKEQSTIDSLEILLKNMPEDAEKAALLNLLSENYLSSDFPTALDRASKAKQLAEKTGHKNASAKSSILQGLALYYLGDHDKALAAYLIAIKIYEDMADKSGIAISLNHIGNLYRKNGDIDNALENFKKAEKLYVEINDKTGIAICYDNIGIAYSEKEDYDRALDYFLKSLALDRTYGHKSDIPYSLINAAGIYSLKGNFSKAEGLYLEALKYREELNDLSGIAINLNEIGELQLLKKNLSSAIEFFERALNISLEIKYKDLTRHIYHMLSEAYSKQNKSAEAIHFMNLSANLKNEIFNEQKSKQITEMQTKYNTEKKEKEIEIQHLKIQEQRLKLNQRNFYIILLFAGLIMISSLAILIYSQSKLKQKQLMDKATMKQQELRLYAIIEGEEKERMRLSQELHDGLGQMLSTVKVNISNLEGKIPETNNRQFHASIAIIDEACSELRNISHNLMPSALQKLGLIPALKEFIDRINQTGMLKAHLQAHGMEQRLSRSVETGLYRIFQELLNNIMKHAQAKNVTLQLVKGNDQITAMLEDDGIGFEMKAIEHSKGIGWKNVKSRVQFLRGNVDIDSHPKGGTTITIEIPLPDHFS